MSKQYQKEQEINPFSQTLKIETRYNYSKSTIGQQESLFLETKALVESEPRTQLYHFHTFKVFKQLSNNAKLIFMWIATKIEWEKEKIELRPEKLCEACSFSPASFYRALEDLKTYAVVVESTSRTKTYWFNPMLFFNGNRLMSFPDSIISPAATKAEKSYESPEDYFNRMNPTLSD